MLVSYPCVFYYDAESDCYTAAIHDLELFTEGNSVEEAFARAKELLISFLKYAKKFDEEVNEPTPFEEVKKNNNNIVCLVDANI